MTRISLLSFCFVSLILPAISAASKPNVVFILADDLGWADTTPYGHTKLYKTPNIERLAKRGMTFTHAYSASPLCSPTRSAILTGLSPARTGITEPNCHLPKVVLKARTGKTANPNQKSIQPEAVTRLATSYPTLAKSLKNAGYVTAHFGKWHLGSEPYSPLEHGFDVDEPHWAGPGPAGNFVAPWKFKDFDPDPGIPDQHLEDRMAKDAIAWMEKNKDRPFFLNYWQFSVHAPFDAKKGLVEKYRPLVDSADPQRSPTYAAMIETMDDAVGTLLDTLDRLHLTENTIIIFTSDNGGNMYDRVDSTTPTSNRPLRGGKATLYEGGTRVPCIVSWPQVTDAGTRSDALIQSEDFYPTLLAGLNIPAAPNQIFDGIDITPALNGSALQRDAIFQYFPHSPPVPDWLPPAVSVHRGDWKLIRIIHGGENGADRHLLFDLKSDLGEQRNLAAEKPQIVVELDQLITDFFSRTHAVTPTPNPEFDPTKYKPELEGVPTMRKAPAQGRSKAKKNPASDKRKLR